jgi:4-amino-4-deoxy-L-arabinose transferase-like glycosyltransferase
MSRIRLNIITSPWLHFIILAALAMPYFINLGASSIWDGSEAFYAETPREMLESGDWLSPHFNFEPRVNKPPLTYWAVAVSYKIFGVNEFAVRLPGALAALGVMLFSWGAAKSSYGPRAALFAAAIAATTPRIFILERRLPIDMLLLFFLTGTLFFLLRAITKKDAINWRCAYVLAALGFMTKGPVAVIIPAGALLAWMIYSKFRFPDIRPLEGAAICLCITRPWYILSYQAHGWDYSASFFLSDNLGRFASESFGPSRGFFYYIPLWFSDFFPWSIIGPAALISLRRGFRDRLKDASFGLPLFWCALIFFMFSFSKNKQEYYIAPMYPAAALLTAGLLDRFGRSDKTEVNEDCKGSLRKPQNQGLRLRQKGAQRRVLGWRLPEVHFRTVPDLWRWIYGILAFLLFLLAFILPFILDILMPGISIVLRLGPSLILIAGAGLTVWHAVRKKSHGAFAALAFSMWIIFFSGALIYVPALENFRPVKDFCATIKNIIRTDSDNADETESGYFRTSLPSMTFYLERRIFEEDDYERMLQRFQSSQRVFCILDSRDYDWFVKNMDIPLHILDRRDRFSIRFGQLFAEEKPDGRELLLVSNRLSPVLFQKGPDGTSAFPWHNTGN